jgi:hypothetical protein
LFRVNPIATQNGDFLVGFIRDPNPHPHLTSINLPFPSAVRPQGTLDRVNKQLTWEE